MILKTAVSLLMILVTSLLSMAVVYGFQTYRLRKWHRPGRKLKKQWFQIRTASDFKWRRWLNMRLVNAGETPKDAKRRAQIWELITGFGFIFIQWRAPFGWGSGLLWLGAMILCFWGITAYQIKSRQFSFATGVYKIYRALSLQLTAGMKVTTSLKQLHDMVDEPFLKEAMHAYSTRYFQTMDLDCATEELTRRIGGPEVHILASVLKQGISTGDHYEMLKKQEQVMVRKYYSAMEAETEMVKRRTVMIAIGLCIIVFLLLALPMIYEMNRATSNIFL